AIRLDAINLSVAAGIGAGPSPAVSGEFDPFWRVHDNCTYCEFDRVCPRDRDEHQQLKAGAPELAVLDRLLPPAEPEDEDEPENASQDGPGEAP
ncbi:MAG TPA: hypothetical protein PKA98_17200, partial [Acidimicrobiales bacterium]|nr:hypothetical protein [Acidimicrobiales bacterium]